MSSIARRRERLWKVSPHCHYCKIITILPSSLSQEKLKRPPSNLATIDHVFHKLDPRRKIDCSKTGRRILACYGCNQKKGKKDNKKFSRIKGLLDSPKKFSILLIDLELNFDL